MLRPETRARARALQLLYLWDLQGRPAPHRVVEQGAALLPTPPPIADRALAMFEDAVNRAEELDRRIAGLIEHWRLERLGAVERGILRLALAELDRGETPPKVVIDEALKLARWFGGSRSPAFINGILDAAARVLGRL